MQHLKQLKKVKVLGYPFAGGQPRGGVELTPSWLQNQAWFKQLANSYKMPVVYEEIKVSSPHCNSVHFDNMKKQGLVKSVDDLPDAKNISNVVKSSFALRSQTAKALQDGYYPIVLGGDHSQAIGSIAGLKHVYPDAKLIWVDAHIDANTPSTSPSKNAHGMPLAYLSGIVPNHDFWKCVNLKTDLLYFGIRSYEDDEKELIDSMGIPIFESKDCTPEKIN